MISNWVNFPGNLEGANEPLGMFMGFHPQGNVLSGEPDSLARAQSGSRSASAIGLVLVLLRDLKELESVLFPCLAAAFIKLLSRGNCNPTSCSGNSGWVYPNWHSKGDSPVVVERRVL